MHCSTPEDMVRALASAKGIHSLKALSRAASLDPRTVTWMVRGEVATKRETIERLASALEISSESLAAILAGGSRG